MNGQSESEATGADRPPFAAATDWEAVHRRYARLVYSVPRRFGLAPEDCDDVYQSTWLTAVSRTAPPPAGDERAMVRWLAAIAAWETRGLLRRRRVRVSETGLLDALPSSCDDVPERLEQIVEDHRIVEESLAALPERDRSLLRSLFLTDEPLSYSELAARMGVAVGSVGPLRLRAIERLRAELTRRGF